MEGLSALLQWSGWAAACGLAGTLVTQWYKRRVSRDAITLQTKRAEIQASEVEIKQRSMDAELIAVATETYRDLLAAQRAEIDDLRARIEALEKREQRCQEQINLLKEENQKLQATLWRIGGSRD